VLGACASARDEAPDREHDGRTDDRADEACAFAGPVPADRLSEVGRHKRAHDPENGCQDKGSFGPGMMNFAITPAMKPMMMVQMNSMRRPPKGRTAPAAALRPSRPRSSLVLRKVSSRGDQRTFNLSRRLLSPRQKPQKPQKPKLS
jgi:hypothetical protein